MNQFHKLSERTGARYSRQRGLSALGMLAVLLIIVFFANFCIKLIPLYIDNATIQSAVETVVEEGKAGKIGVSEMKSRLGKLFQVNMIDAIDHRKDIKFSRKNGRTVVDARYERRVHLMFNIDVVVKFDQLLYEYATTGK